MSLYEFAMSSPRVYTDPMGLWRERDPLQSLADAHRHADGAVIQNFKMGIIDQPTASALLEYNHQMHLRGAYAFATEETAATQTAMRATGETGATMLPGLGEVADASILFAADSSCNERKLALGSLTLNICTLGFAPNVAPALRAARCAKNAVTALPTPASLASIPPSTSSNGVCSANPAGALNTTGAKTTLALPAPSQIQANWGINTYRHGGQMSAIEHINYRHSFNSGFQNVSRFAEGTSVRGIQGYVDDALRYGRITRIGPNKFRIDYNLGRTIGADATGNAASYLRVFVRDGNIQTAFPF